LREIRMIGRCATSPSENTSLDGSSWAVYGRSMDLILSQPKSDSKMPSEDGNAKLRSLKVVLKGRTATHCCALSLKAG